MGAAEDALQGRRCPLRGKGTFGDHKAPSGRRRTTPGNRGHDFIARWFEHLGVAA
jgi:hypothetical protein